MNDPYAFKLDPQLEKDTVLISDWHLCQVRLMNDSRYPWVILIPKVEGVSEIHELAEEQRQLLLGESMRLSKALDQLFSPHKLNIAALPVIWFGSFTSTTLSVLRATLRFPSLSGVWVRQCLTM